MKKPLVIDQWFFHVILAFPGSALHKRLDLLLQKVKHLGNQIPVRDRTLTGIISRPFSSRYFPQLTMGAKYR